MKFVVVLILIIGINTCYSDEDLKLDIENIGFLSYIENHIDQTADSLMRDLFSKRIFYNKTQYIYYDLNHIKGCSFFYGDSICLNIFFLGGPRFKRSLDEYPINKIMSYYINEIQIVHRKTLPNGDIKILSRVIPEILHPYYIESIDEYTGQHRKDSLYKWDKLFKR